MVRNPSTTSRSSSRGMSPRDTMADRGRVVGEAGNHRWNLDFAGESMHYNTYSYFALMLHSNRDWLSSLKTHVRQDVWNIDRFAERARCWSFANYLSQTQIQTNEKLVYLVKRNILHLLSRINVHNFHTNKTWGSLRKSQYQPACCHTIWKKKTTIIDQWIYQLTLLSAAIRTAAFANLRKGLSTGEIATAMLCTTGGLMWIDWKIYCTKEMVSS